MLSGFASIAEGVVAPTDRAGDRVGAILDRETGSVTVPEEVAALRTYFAGGWVGVSAPVERGGGGFPKVVGAAINEMCCSANMALSLNPLLTQSAIELLEIWGNDQQHESVLDRLVEGRWTGTMNLIEPDAGSDLGAARATAAPIDDRYWGINGTKIFITWGEHDITDNIVHLVLARTPRTPAGTKGISPFLVPKRLITFSVSLVRGTACTVGRWNTSLASTPARRA